MRLGGRCFGKKGAKSCPCGAAYQCGGGPGRSFGMDNKLRRLNRVNCGSFWTLDKAALSPHTVCFFAFRPLQRTAVTVG